MSEFLENLKLLFLNEKEISGKEFLNVEEFNKAEREIIASLLNKEYLIEVKRSNKKFYNIGERGIEILKENIDFWDELQKEKKIRRAKLLREALLVVKETKGKRNITKTFFNEFSFTLKNALEENLITEILPQRYELTSYGENRLFALRPPQEIAVDLQQIIDDVSNKVILLSESINNYFVDDQIKEHMNKFIDNKKIVLEKHLEKAVENAKNMEEEIKLSNIAAKYKQEMIAKIKQNNKTFTTETKLIKQDFKDELKKCSEELKTIQNHCSNEKKNIKEEQDEVSMRLEKIFELHMAIKKNLGVYTSANSATSSVSLSLLPKNNQENFKSDVSEKKIPKEDNLQNDKPNLF